MKQLFLFVLLIGLLAWAYFHFYGGATETPPPEAHLAKQGTFFVLQYVSVPAPNGVIGFEPGREVHFVRADQAKGLLVVSDGQYQVEMKPSQLTNDLDIAALAHKGDQESQQQITAFIAHEKAVYDARTRAMNIMDALELERARKNAAGAGQPANAGAANNPYSYLSSPR